MEHYKRLSIRERSCVITAAVQGVPIANVAGHDPNSPLFIPYVYREKLQKISFYLEFRLPLMPDDFRQEVLKNWGFHAPNQGVDKCTPENLTARAMLYP